MAITGTAQIRQNSILIYKSSDHRRTKTDEEKEQAKKNLLQNRESEKEKYEYNGEINNSAQRKIRKIVENWNITLKYQSSGKKIKSSERRQLSFVTLTLSHHQQHDDYEIKRKMLNHFIIKIQRNHGVKNYVWKCELQGNGNLHFHLVIDSYIHHKKIRHIWNEIQEKLGYITEFEKLHGHRDPNSTDVKSVKNSSLVAVYLSKYISKKEKKQELQEGETERKIKGRVWGSNKELKELEFFSLMESIEVWENYETYGEVNSDFYSIFNKLKETEGYKRIEINEYCEIHCFSFEIGRFFGFEYDNFYSNQFDLIYN